MKRSLNADPATWRYKALIGTGGIGSGTFFALKGNHTLGREESRSGRFLDRRDYCKLHIIQHYVAVLMGAGFVTVPVGKVGDDAPGRQMIEEMREAGLSVEHVQVVPGDQTLYSICFVYPDGTGGNLTVDDSACAKVDPETIRRVEKEFARFAGTGMTLAAPEVPLEARAELLRLGRQYRFFNTASFTSGELQAAGTTGNHKRHTDGHDGGLVRDMLAMVDFLAINRHEAAMLAGVPAEESPQRVVDGAIEVLRGIQPQMRFSVTAGAKGSWTWDGKAVSFVPGHRVNVVNTAGAGDSFLGGMIAGIALGLPLAEAQQLATLVAALKVTSSHTINKDIDRDSLRALAAQVNARLSKRVRHLLEVAP